MNFGIWIPILLQSCSFPTYVRVSFDDGHVETGSVEEIGLAANSNAKSGEHLPVSIKVNSHTVSIAIIRKIEII